MWMMPLHLHVNQKSEYDMMMMTIGNIYNKIIHLILRTKQIEHTLIKVNTSLRSRKMLKNDIKCDYSVNRGRRV